MRKNKKVITLFTLLVLILSSMVYAIDVDLQELESQNLKEIDYINYTGENEFFNTADEIKSIGKMLARAVERQADSAGYPQRYAAARVLPPADSDSPGADIIIFGSSARVDHINNLRRIIAGYLQEGFKYDEVKSNQLAESITIYNTILRGNESYFYGRYIPEVRSWINSNNAGLSRNYAEWAGGTRIVIPVVTERRITTPGAVSAAPGAVSAAPGAGTAAPAAGTAAPAAGTAAPDEKYEVSVSEKEIEEKIEQHREEERIKAAEKTAPAEKSFFAGLAGSITIPLLLILLLLTLIAIIYIIIKMKNTDRTGITAVLTDKERRILASADYPVVMRIILHGYLLKRKVICDLSPGSVKTVGGKGSSFYIQEVNLPPDIAEIENNGKNYIFRPVRKSYFRDTDIIESELLGREIEILLPDEKPKGGKLSVNFNQYQSPLDNINKVLRSVPHPEKTKGQVVKGKNISDQ